LAERGKALKIENCKLKTANLIVLRSTGVPRPWAHAQGARATSRSVTPLRPICNLHFSILNFQCLYFFALLALLFALCAPASAQVIADKTVASVTNGSQTVPDLITYSDLVWQLALEPGRPFSERPSSEALNEALVRLEEQLLVLQEARKLPLEQKPEAIKEFDDEVKQTRDDLARRFGSARQLEERMRRVGLTSEQLDQILRDRVTMERYVDFRFRPFALVSAKEISERYEKEAASLRGRGRIVPTLEKEHDRIEHDLIEEKIQGDIDKFIDSLRDQPGTEIVILNPV
jgi:hypothetical protein